MNLLLFSRWWSSFQKRKINVVSVVVMASPCSWCELLLDAIPWSVIPLVSSVMFQACLSHAMKCGTEADGAIAGPSTVLCLAGRDDFSAQDQQLQMHDVNAPDLPCTIHGWFRILSSMSLPSSQYCLVSPLLLSFINALYSWPVHL